MSILLHKLALLLMSLTALMGLSRPLPAHINFGGINPTKAQLAQDALDNPFTDKGTLLELKKNSTVEQAGEVTSEVMLTEPKIRLKKFNGEVNLGVTYTGMNGHTTGARKFLSATTEWKEGTQVMEAVPIQATTTMEDGGMEINIILNAKPASNVFTFQLDNWQNLDFFYQPELTKQEIQEGTQRPDNVVGSYAVYYKDHANHRIGSTNYATGKAYHIFRPLVTDNNGNTTWADLSYANGVLTVIVPQSFLDNAVYPVKVDPTFGYTSQGASDDLLNSNVAGNQWEGTTFNLSVGGTVTAINAFVKRTNATTPTWRGEIYVNASSIPTTLKIAPAATAVSNTTYTDQTVSTSVVLTSGNYFLGAAGDGGFNNTINMAMDTTGATGYHCETGNWTIGTAPDPWSCTGGGASDANQDSIYATYTASATTPATPSLNIQGKVNIMGKIQI